ncbi:MAG TPA: sulfurtransferase-like selenium metabolism protein YedF [Bacteroidales bacterium]|nr:sulfurtransferase-like selenium metabolism protein YedF [Bacteroidales bacterium]
MRVVDTKGQQCPAPLIATRKAIKESKEGETIRIIIDNKTSFDNVARFLRDNNILFSSEEEKGIWTLSVTKTGTGEPSGNIEEYCSTAVPHFNKGNFVIVFSSDKMGEGDIELGTMLMSNFIRAVKDLDVLPGKMLFYNSGVRLGTTDSDVYESLKEIEQMGVGLLFCGTCVKFYDIQEKIKIGILSNMFEIAQVMASAGNVVKP